MIIIYNHLMDLYKVVLGSELSFNREGTFRRPQGHITQSLNLKYCSRSNLTKVLSNTAAKNNVFNPLQIFFSRCCSFLTWIYYRFFETFLYYKTITLKYLFQYSIYSKISILLCICKEFSSIFNGYWLFFKTLIKKI